MLYETLKALHVLSIIVWVGGMVFAHFFLRPAVAALEGPQRLRLMHDVLGRFFRVVLVVSLLALGTGVWMLGRVAKQVVQAGGNFQMPWGWMVMAVLGTVMVAIFMVIRFRFFRGLHEAVVQADWAQGAAQLARIRTWVGVNLALGIVVTVVAYTGRA
jgi:uncharacterized membrane protein